MKYRKYLLTMLLTATVGSLATSCSDDDNLGDAPRLFRPIASSTVNSNTLKVEWDKIQGATSYELKLMQLTGKTNDEGVELAKEVRTITTEDDTYTFDDLDWDEKYGVEIKCIGDNKESEYYKVKAQAVNYPTKVNNAKAIDNAVRVSWAEGGQQIKYILACPAEDAATKDTIKVKVSDAEYAQGYKDVNGLQPETSYTFKTYDSSSEIDNTTYAGRITSTTKASENFDEKYGAGNWLDIRSWDEKEAKDTLKTKEFWEQVKDGMTIILRGEQEYKISNAISLDRNVTFITGMTLGGNAQFTFSGGMNIAKGVNINKVKFEGIDMISDKQADKDAFLAGTDKSFGGRQVINVSGTGSTIDELVFNDCYIRGFRGVVRGQKDTDAFLNVTFKGCTIDGVGDQGVVTIADKGGDFRNVTFDDCTITNIVMLCDLRKTKQAPTVNVSNCTFCYAPIERTDKPDTPLFRFASNTAALNITNSVFGPSMATEESKGAKVSLYTPGTMGSILLNGSNTVATVTGSYKTNFTYTTPTSTPGVTYGIEGLIEYKGSETDLWTSPVTGEFKFKNNLASEAGASKWK